MATQYTNSDLNGLVEKYGAHIQKIHAAAKELDRRYGRSTTWPGLNEGAFLVQGLDSLFPYIEKISRGELVLDYALNRLNVLKERMPDSLGNEKEILQLWIYRLTKHQVDIDQFLGKGPDVIGFRASKKIFRRIFDYSKSIARYISACDSIDHVREAWQNEFVPVLNGIASRLEQAERERKQKLENAEAEARRLLQERVDQNVKAARARSPGSRGKRGDYTRY